MLASAWGYLPCILSGINNVVIFIMGLHSCTLLEKYVV